MNSFIHSLIYSFIFLTIHSSLRPNHSFIHPSNHPFIHPSIQLFIHPFIHSFIHSFIHPSTHQLIYTFIHSYVHPSILKTRVMMCSEECANSSQSQSQESKPIVHKQVRQLSSENFFFAFTKAEEQPTCGRCACCC
jgi:hypothetical protein